MGASCGFFAPPCAWGLAARASLSTARWRSGNRHGRIPSFRRAACPRKSGEPRKAKRRKLLLRRRMMEPALLLGRGDGTHAVDHRQSFAVGFHVRKRSGSVMLAQNHRQAGARQLSRHGEAAPLFVPVQHRGEAGRVQLAKQAHFIAKISASLPRHLDVRGHRRAQVTAPARGKHHCPRADSRGFPWAGMCDRAARRDRRCRASAPDVAWSVSSFRDSCDDGGNDAAS